MADNTDYALNKIRRRVYAIIRDEAEAKICRYIAQNTDHENFLFAGTISGAARAAQTSYNRATATFKRLKARGLLTRVKRGLYRVNPALFIVLDS
jgi:predicted transcriptional regulator of viral defense system